MTECIAPTGCHPGQPVFATLRSGNCALPIVATANSSRWKYKHLGCSTYTRFMSKVQILSQLGGKGPSIALHEATFAMRASATRSFDQTFIVFDSWC